MPLAARALSKASWIAEFQRLLFSQGAERCKCRCRNKAGVRGFRARSRTHRYRLHPNEDRIESRRLPLQTFGNEVLRWKRVAEFSRKFKPKSFMKPERGFRKIGSLWPRAATLVCF